MHSDSWVLGSLPCKAFGYQMDSESLLDMFPFDPLLLVTGRIYSPCGEKFGFGQCWAALAQGYHLDLLLNLVNESWQVNISQHYARMKQI